MFNRGVIIGMPFFLTGFVVISFFSRIFLNFFFSASNLDLSTLISSKKDLYSFKTSLFMLVFLLIVFGLTQIIVNSYLFEGIRTFFEKFFPLIGKMLNCTQCAGFWGGIFVSLFLPVTYNYLNCDIIYINIIVGCFFDGLISSGFNLIANKVLYVLMSCENALDVYVDKHIPED